MECPKCGVDAEQCGEIIADGKTTPIYQCEECTAFKDIFGEPFEVALTFAVDESGNIFDPADEE